MASSHVARPPDVASEPRVVVECAAGWPHEDLVEGEDLQEAFDLSMVSLDTVQVLHHRLRPH